MSKRIPPLADFAIKNAKPKSKDYKLSDGYGLYLLVKRTGVKLWQMQYRYHGKPQTISFGYYSDKNGRIILSLSDARDKRDDARRQLLKGLNPTAVRKQEKATALKEENNTFEVVARQWHEKFKSSWEEKTGRRILASLKKDVFPIIGKTPISKIETPDMVDLLSKIAERTLETAHKIKISCQGVFRHAVLTGSIKHSPMADMRNVLPSVKNNHFAAPTTPKDLAPLLRAIDGYEGTLVVKCAMQFAPLVFVRPGELRHAEWKEIDFEAKEWNIPAKKMKMKRDHLVPLSDQAIEILRKLQPLTGHSPYIFPGQRSLLRPMSDAAVNAAFRRMGFGKDVIVGHGFRATARTILAEVFYFRVDIIEHQLAHIVKDPTGRAYNRTEFLPYRRVMMQKWADFLDMIKENNFDPSPIILEVSELIAIS
ncbi:tyrosine-type recombinase/integrase [Geomonas sp. RF6]|uniref:tyrosine-type recombinase/integrase n=1 Tax=Geomonas sp. RF6 TaxID=2897342 RepID=UPI001E417CC6|nr:integrase arm-type DNA-binding domain-containing protein [Geomonas sp. RF6]UFS72640.1 tyrosine-type recombinase/integrase [Geomonas sp. RF6]